MAIEEIEKPPNQACPHLCAKGCGIYTKRPMECQRFNCMWLDGTLPAWMKPNKTHSVVWPGHVEGPDNQVIPVVRINFNKAFGLHNRVWRWALKASQKYLVIATRGKRFEAILAGKVWDCGVDGDTWKFVVEDGRIVDVQVEPKEAA